MSNPTNNKPQGNQQQKPQPPAAQQNKPAEPPKPPDPPPAVKVETAEEYLLRHGWQPDTDGSWQDPKANEPVQPVELVLPTAGGGKEILQQKCGPVCAWNYVKEEAVSVQRQREKVGR